MGISNLDFTVTALPDSQSVDMTPWVTDIHMAFAINSTPKFVMNMTSPGGIKDLNLQNALVKGLGYSIAFQYDDPFLGTSVTTTFNQLVTAGFYPQQSWAGIVPVQLLTSYEALTNYGIYSPFYAPGTSALTVDLTNAIGQPFSLTSQSNDIGSLISSGLNQMNDKVYGGSVPGAYVTDYSALAATYNVPQIHAKISSAIADITHPANLTLRDTTTTPYGFQDLFNRTISGGTNMSFWDLLRALCLRLNIIIIPVSSDRIVLAPAPSIQQMVTANDSSIVDITDYNSASHVVAPLAASVRPLRQVRILSPMKRTRNNNEQVEVPVVFDTIQFDGAAVDGYTLDFAFPAELRYLMGLHLDPLLHPAHVSAGISSIPLVDTASRDIMKAYVISSALHRMFNRNVTLELPFTTQIAPGTIVRFPVDVFPANFSSGSQQSRSENFYGFVNQVMISLTRDKAVTVLQLGNVQSDTEAKSISIPSGTMTNGSNSFYPSSTVKDSQQKLGS